MQARGAAARRRELSAPGRTPRGTALHRPAESPGGARPRFLHADRYRVGREWKRYEGTAQRDLFRELRVRMLDEFRAEGGWVLEVGPGPGRFSPRVGTGSVRRVLLDLSEKMLRAAAERWGETAGSNAPGGRPDLVRADGLYLPVRDGCWSEVVAIGNSIGFSGDSAERFVKGLASLVAAGGWLHLELSAGSGTRSRYLHRLPPSAVTRLLEAPPRLVEARVLREGFDVLPETRARLHGFRRLDSAWVRRELEKEGLDVLEVRAVAPALGSEAACLTTVQANRRSWAHLLELEESLGRGASALTRASAYLIAARRPPETQTR